jgi:hypothetical protein
VIAITPIYKPVHPPTGHDSTNSVSPGGGGGGDRGEKARANRGLMN